MVTSEKEQNSPGFHQLLSKNEKELGKVGHLPALIPLKTRISPKVRLVSESTSTYISISKNVYPSSFRKSLLSQRKVLLHRGEIRKAESILLKISLTRSICVNILQGIPIFQLSNHNRSCNKLSRMFFSS